MLKAGKLAARIALLCRLVGRMDNDPIVFSQVQGLYILQKNA